MTTTAPPPVTERTACRACGSAEMTPLFSLGSLYVSNFVDRAEVEAGYPHCPRCPLELQLCRGCTLVQLRHTAPQELLYARKYWFRSAGSATNRAALADLVRAAGESVGGLGREDYWVDVGSYDGELLREVHRQWAVGLTSFGVEPADNLAIQENYPHSFLLHGFWPLNSDPKLNDLSGRCRVITAAGMFYDLEDPSAFVRGVAQCLHPGGVFVAQLMCLRQTVEILDVSNFCHEHLEYYSLESLERMYAAAGLEVFDLETNAVNGGSYRLYARLAGSKVGEAREALGRVDQARCAEAAMGLASPARLHEFYQRLLQQRHDVQKLIYQARKGGRQVYALGASTKGNTLLQWWQLDATLVAAAADANPEKWGRYTAGTGVPVISKEAFRHSPVDYALVLPYAFRAELAAEEAEQPWRRKGGKLVVPIPKLEIL